jgi:hypothetical protein
MWSLSHGNLKGGGTLWYLKKKTGMNGKKMMREKKTGKNFPHSNLLLIIIFLYQIHRQNRQQTKEG